MQQEHLYKQFQIDGHKGFLNEASVTFIDKAEKREIYWMRLSKTIESYGHNIADSVQSAHTVFCLFISLGPLLFS